MLKLQTRLFKVTFKLPLVVQSKNKMHFILNFTEVVQSPVKIWVSERKRTREQEIGWTNSSFKSELRHLWVRHKNCHFRSPAWCIRHTQELGLAQSFPWHCRSLWRTQSTREGRRVPFSNGPSTVRSYPCLLSASSQGQQECQTRKAEKCCSCLVAAQEEREDPVTPNRKAVQERQRESRSSSSATCTDVSTGKPVSPVLADISCQQNKLCHCRQSWEHWEKQLHSQGNSTKCLWSDGCMELVHICTWSLSAASWASSKVEIYEALHNFLTAAPYKLLVSKVSRYYP